MQRCRAALSASPAAPPGSAPTLYSRSRSQSFFSPPARGAREPRTERIKVGTAALRGWVRATASAAGSLCSLPRSPGALARPGGMLLRELLGLLRRCWPSLLLHCALHPLWGSVQITQGEPQKSCSKPVADKVTESCEQICQCRPPPPLPPPPPPPPPPRLLVVPTPKSTFCPTEETWWPGLVIIIAVCCATLVFLFVVVIICYKAIKRTRAN
ncbi:proline-rich membrane anchor 1 isoform X3 [Cuculus canorus]|uniref:proline-rich membrane anchor 1 isoform X3 n=1 Tax=Cuculus canorus TaxID=55661 RepID=UPI0023AA47AC|nr:proline-rich membrane anchor 1 isoform X3 [Cuculus canorus]